MTRLSIAVMVAFFALGSPAIAQVPPPPPLTGQVDLARDLVAHFADKNVAAYAALLSPHVQVYDDGVLVARSRQEWMQRFGPELAAKE